MSSIEINIGSQKVVLRAEESEDHLKEVAEIVRRKVENLRKRTPSLTLHKAAMLVAFDFASETLKGRQKALDYRSSLLAKAHELLERVESELVER